MSQLELILLFLSFQTIKIQYDEQIFFTSFIYGEFFYDKCSAKLLMGGIWYFIYSG